MGNIENGVKIRNYESGSIEERQQGVREIYDFTDAILTKSLFLDFLLNNGLKVSKNGFTKQIVGVLFNYGTRSYEEERKHLEALIAKKSENEKLLRLLVQCDANKEKYKHLSPAEVREKFYTEGFDINYGNQEVIHYKMLFRSAAKAKKGLCMFIDKRLYKKAHDFLWMDIKIPKKNAPIVEVGAYSALVTSTMIDKIQINPNDVLIVKDVKSSFRTNIISVEIGEDSHCIAKQLEDYEISYDMFDGEALIDSSIFPKWADGFVLLRQHFTKCAAFCTNIQLFFKDYFKEKYETAKLLDMFGNWHNVKDIKMITTNNAVKWIKMSVTYQHWRDKVLQNGGFWGIVKTSHESKLGDAQRMSYQMVNTLTEEIMQEVMIPSIEYVEKLKSDINTYVDYLRRNISFTNDYDVLIALYEQDHSFQQSTYWQNRKNAIISTYITDLKNGRLRQEADNCTIVGSPYALLLHAVGESVEKDSTLQPEKGCIQCYSERFNDQEYLAGFRSPHNSQSNICVLHNIHSGEMEKYFNLGKLCIAINTRHTDAEDRLNGADFDADSLFITNQKSIVEHAKWCYKEYPTVVNNIPKETNHYDNDLKQYAAIDSKLAATQLAIGESSNLAQISLTYEHTFKDAKYRDMSCILAVLAQCAIDNSKRTYALDINEEIAYIRKKLDIATNQLPEFWKATSIRGIRKQFKNYQAQQSQMSKIHGKINPELHCPMNMAYNIAIPRVKNNVSLKSMKDFFLKVPSNEGIRINKQIESLIEKYSLSLYQDKVVNYCQENEDYILCREDFENLVEEIRQSVIPSKYIGLFSWLIDRAFIITPPMLRNRNKLSTALNKNRPLLLKCLYSVNPEALLKCFSKNVNCKK